MRKKLVQTNLGIWTKEDVAKDLDNLLATLPAEQRQLRRKALASTTESIDSKGRTEISVITTENPDLEDDVVIAKGIDQTYFNRNPVVCLSHDMSTECGKCQWIKPTMSGGLKAQTFYPPRPEWYADGVWLPDHVLACIQSGLYLGKSIGFVARNVRAPLPQELETRPDWKGMRIIDDCLLLEYSVCVAGLNQDALVQAVAKGLKAESMKALGITPPKRKKSLAERLAEYDWERLAEDLVRSYTGKV